MHCQFRDVRIVPSPKVERYHEWLMDNRELIEFCLEVGFPLPLYQAFNFKVKTQND